MAAPVEFIYTYEEKRQEKKPNNNATYISTATRNDPNFMWQNTGQKTGRGQTIWIRATKRKIKPEYKEYLAAKKARNNAEMNALATMMSETNFGTNVQYKFQPNGHIIQVERPNNSESMNLNATLTKFKIDGGKKHKHTRRYRHTRRYHH